MNAPFKFRRGDLISDIQLGGAPFRVSSRLRDIDTDVALYMIQRIDDNNELLRNAKLIDNLDCFKRYDSGS